MTGLHRCRRQAAAFLLATMLQGAFSIYLGSTANAQQGEAVTIELDIVDGAVPGRDSPIRVEEGDHVTLVWTSDRETEIHLHGYDLEATIYPGAPIEMYLDATATGRFPITAHTADGGHATLQYLEVHPR